MAHVWQGLDPLCSECFALIKKKEHLREITHYQEQVTTAPWVVEVGTDAQPKQPPQITEGRQRPSGGRQ